MPGITDRQWDAIRTTAERTARRVAQEALGQTVAANRASIPAGKPPRQDNDRFTRGDEGFTFFRGEWRRESQAEFDVRKKYAPHAMPGTPIRVPTRILEPCRMDFSMLRPFCGYPDLRSEAQQLFDRGYTGVSNKYRMIVRIDRPDWIEVLARKYRKAPADFYVRDDTGFVTESTGRWGEHYATMFSLDKVEDVHPDTYNELKRLRAAAGGDIKYVP